MVMQSQLDGNKNIRPDTRYLSVETKGAKVGAVICTPLRHSSFHHPVCYLPNSSGHGRACTKYVKCFQNLGAMQCVEQEILGL